MLFHPLVVLKAPNLKELWLFKHTPMMGKVEDFSYFSPKSSTLNYIFFWKNKKNLPFSPPWKCVWTIITLSNLELLVQPADRKTSKKFTLFHLKKLFFSLFGPIYAILGTKRVYFWRKWGKNGGKKTKSNFFWKTDKMKTFA